jgi:hypothetical protein
VGEEDSAVGGEEDGVWSVVWPRADPLRKKNAEIPKAHEKRKTGTVDVFPSPIT